MFVVELDGDQQDAVEVVVATVLKSLDSSWEINLAHACLFVCWLWFPIPILMIFSSLFAFCEHVVLGFVLWLQSSLFRVLVAARQTVADLESSIDGYRSRDYKEDDISKPPPSDPLRCDCFAHNKAGSNLNVLSKSIR